jgi:transketolase
VLEDHAPVGALGDLLRRTLAAKDVTAFGVEGWPACGTPLEALCHHGLDGASLADRIASLTRLRVS